MFEAKRPYLIHFNAIKTEDQLHIKAALVLRNPNKIIKLQAENRRPSFPIQAYKMLTGNNFVIKIVGLNEERKQVFQQRFESNSFGNFKIKVNLNNENKDLHFIEVYEVSSEQGIEFNMGTFIPNIIENPKKLIICDFDKTLVETKYSSTKEVYNSLTRPLEYFPTIPKSLEIVREYVDKGYHPFILSASPHFYEEAIRDWLYKNQIFTAGIFLKDYRHFFSISEGFLSPKDIKIQGLYKLNHLLDIIIMTGIPHELVLMGDNFESDPIIYLTLASLLLDQNDPWVIWKQLQKQKVFALSGSQHSKFLNKIYKIKHIIKNSNVKSEIKIFIRKRHKETDIDVPIKELRDKKSFIELYDAPPTSGPGKVEQLAE